MKINSKHDYNKRVREAELSRYFSRGIFFADMTVYAIVGVMIWIIFAAMPDHEPPMTYQQKADKVVECESLGLQPHYSNVTGQMMCWDKTT